MPPKKKVTKGVGYAGAERDSQNIVKHLAQAEKKYAKEHLETTRYLNDFKSKLSASLQDDVKAFQFLSEFLPTSEEKKKIEKILQQVFLHHSPTEWDSKEKCVLIHAALGICDLLGGDPQLASAIFHSTDNDGENSLLELLRNFTHQAEMIAKKAHQFQSKGTDIDDIQVATYFLQVQERIERTLSQIQELHLDIEGDKKMAAKDEKKEEKKQAFSQEQLEANYKQQLRKVPRLDFVECLGHHHFASHRSYTGDSRRLYRELMSYQQALPVEYSSSIFVRVIENRIDLLRALIIGPDETPYANGCFFFDIYIPPDYPNVPPKVHFLTTGHGKMRFNPNLYQNGKVCLSLLGTWAGPGWIANKSTLLQVLISIQSLIFVNDPYYNEPAFDRQQDTKHGKSQSKKYNDNIERGTIKYGLEDHIERLADANKESLYPEFDDILIRHFGLKASDIQEQIGNQNGIYDRLTQIEELCLNLCSGSLKTGKAKQDANVKDSNSNKSLQNSKRIGTPLVAEASISSRHDTTNSKISSWKHSHADLVSEVITLDDDGITDHNDAPLLKNGDEIICLNDSEDDDDDVEVTSSSKKRKHSSDNRDEIIEIE
ncbi:hypothetical protein CTEN210_18497 [Chaetoceros tenuissimus]|uniref:UBC core domain-containing protein n=1 Tax=Chaetoceros tenuissimus TaxID=426638 RepID=A0AAD3DCY7_9STRA|nr:hypothetical protein CTEN210_18497 [Chaetoceros tenuissimus]